MIVRLSWVYENSVHVFFQEDGMNLEVEGYLVFWTEDQNFEFLLSL